MVSIYSPIESARSWLEQSQQSGKRNQAISFLTPCDSAKI
nr:MAG TPA: hypothetical protein [Caudoviricetes sp.]